MAHRLQKAVEDTIKLFSDREYEPFALAAAISQMIYKAQEEGHGDRASDLFELGMLVAQHFEKQPA